MSVSDGSVRTVRISSDYSQESSFSWISRNHSRVSTFSSLSTEEWKATGCSKIKPIITLVAITIILPGIAIACYSEPSRTITGLTPRTYDVINLQMALSFLITTIGTEKIIPGRCFVEGRVCSYEFFAAVMLSQLALYGLTLTGGATDFICIGSFAVSFLTTVAALMIAKYKIEQQKSSLVESALREPLV